MKNTIKKIVVFSLILLIWFACSGCQVDINGPDISMKAMYKGENGDREYLSRGSGKNGTGSFTAGGSEIKMWSFGNVDRSEQE